MMMPQMMPKVSSKCLACFNLYDNDGDKALSIAEFTSICKDTFRKPTGAPYEIDPQRIADMFNIFNTSGDGSMSLQDFSECYEKWICKIVKPRSALVIVDVQNDFISGSLAIINCPAKQDGEDVVEPINYLLDTVQFDQYYYSLDWHPSDHVSFIDNVHQRRLAPGSKEPCLYGTVTFEGPPKMDQVLWPRHCVQESWGAELHKQLKLHPRKNIVYKGTNPNVDSYSAFFDNAKLGKTPLAELIKESGCTDVYVCGIATDVCVASTAFHALELGFRTCLIDDCSRGIDEKNIADCYDKIRSWHGLVIDSSEVRNMVLGRDRRPELGYKLALEFRSNFTYPAKNKNSKYNGETCNPDGSLKIT